MIAEAYAGLSAFKTMFDLAKGIKDINDVATRNAVAIELQEKILAAQAAQAALLEKVGDLEKEMARLKTWNTEKQRYQLEQVGRGTFAYRLKPGVEPSEPDHLICANCFEHGRSILQGGNLMEGSNQRGYACPRCKQTIGISRWQPAS